MENWKVISQKSFQREITRGIYYVFKNGPRRIFYYHMTDDFIVLILIASHRVINILRNIIKK